jgi:hypothetical protein
MWRQLCKPYGKKSGTQPCMLTFQGLVPVDITWLVVQAETEGGTPH